MNGFSDEKKLVQEILDSFRNDHCKEDEMQFVLDILKITSSSSLQSLEDKISIINNLCVAKVRSLIDENFSLQMVYQSKRKSLLDNIFNDCLPEKNDTLVLTDDHSGIPSNSFFSNVPQEWLINLCGYLDANTLSSAFVLCKKWHQALKSRDDCLVRNGNFFFNKINLEENPCKLHDKEICGVYSHENSFPVSHIGDFICWYERKENDFLLHAKNLHTERKITLKGHSNYITQLVSHKSYKNHLLSSSEDGRIILWDLETIKTPLILDLNSPVLNIESDPFNQIISISSNGMISIHNHNRMTHQLFIDQELAFLELVCVGVWKSRYAIGFPTGVFRVFQTSNNQELFQLKDPLLFDPSNEVFLDFNSFFHMRSNFLLTRSAKPYELCVWDLTNGNIVRRLSEPSNNNMEEVKRNDIEFAEVNDDFTSIFSLNGRYLMEWSIHQNIDYQLSREIFENSDNEFFILSKK